MARTTPIITCSYSSPCGLLQLGAFDGRLCMCDWAHSPHAPGVARRLTRLLHAPMAEGSSEVTAEACRQLDEYFAGQRREFDISLLAAGTGFQQRVWQELTGIPFGTTTTYASIARRIGSPAAVRAVAAATGANALSIFIPCHRVVGADGALTGYAGGLPAKSTLLALEHHTLARF